MEEVCGFSRGECSLQVPAQRYAERHVAGGDYTSHCGRWSAFQLTLEIQQLNHKSRGNAVPWAGGTV